MSTAAKERNVPNPISASEGERAALERLAMVLKERGLKGARIRFADNDLFQIELPQSAVAILRIAVEGLANGDGMSLVRVERELTSQQTADLLNVSRQYVARLADNGELPSSATEGGHRRFRLADVLSYKQRRDAGRKKAIRELMDLTEEHDGYPELDDR